MAVFTKRPSYDARGAADVGQYFSQYISIMQEQIEFAVSSIQKTILEQSENSSLSQTETRLAIDQMSSSLSGITSSLQSAQAQITKLSSEVDALEQRISKLEG